MLTSTPLRGTQCFLLQPHHPQCNLKTADDIKIKAYQEFSYVGLLNTKFNAKRFKLVKI